MPLSSPVSRTLRHTRAIQVDAYARDDGLWDLDARITDVKTRDIALAYLYLASDDASFVNGAVLSVDGGLVVGT